MITRPTLPRWRIWGYDAGEGGSGRQGAAAVTLAELHAALNDFPPALFLASVVFDLWGAGGKKEGLIAAAHWCLVTAGAMALLAMTSGLLAEEQVEQTVEVHRLLETHETLGITVTVVLVALAAWRLWRKNVFSVPERQSYMTIALVGALATLWLAHLGGTMVYRHAAGIPAAVLQTELRERADSSVRTNGR